MRFYKNSRPVRTASLSQVRRPISTASVAKWKPYAKHLEPLLDSLGDLVRQHDKSVSIPKSSSFE